MSLKPSLFGFLRSEGPPPGLSARPYRDAVLVHGTLALVIVGLGWATGTHLGRAAAMAAGYFALATAWTVWRLRRRITAPKREETP